MLSHDEFWHRAGSGVSGTLWLVVWRSWKEVADVVGFDGVDLLDDIVRGLFARAAESAEMSAVVSLNVFAAFWSEPTPAELADDQIQRFQPLSVEFGNARAELDLVTATVEVRAGQGPPAVHATAQSAVDDLLRVSATETLPHRLLDLKT